MIDRDKSPLANAMNTLGHLEDQCRAAKRLCPEHFENIDAARRIYETIVKFLTRKNTFTKWDAVWIEGRCEEAAMLMDATMTPVQ